MKSYQSARKKGCSTNICRSKIVQRNQSMGCLSHIILHFTCAVKVIKFYAVGIKYEHFEPANVAKVK